MMAPELGAPDGGREEAEAVLQGGAPEELQTRAAAETARQEAEGRAAEEQQARATAEAARQEAEQRVTEEQQARATAEAARQEAEQRVTEEQQARATAEAARQEAELRADEEERSRKKLERRARKTEEKTSKSEEDVIQLSASYAQDATRAGIPRQVAVTAQWEGSSARTKARARLFVCGVVAVVFLSGAGALGILTATNDIGVGFSAGYGGALCLMAVGAITVGIYWYASALARFLDARELATAVTESSQEEQTERDKDLDELLRLNRTQMQAYQTLSRGQQRSAFRSSLIALFAGLVVLVGGIVIVVVVNGDTSKVAVAGVAGLGGALSSYIAGTYLKLHQEASSQLRFFSDQPIVTSYIYEAERLVTKLPKGNSQTATYNAVIRDILGIAQRDAASLSQAQRSSRDSPQRRASARRRRSRQGEAAANSKDDGDS
jgi:hypothetical protein